MHDFLRVTFSRLRGVSEHKTSPLRGVLNTFLLAYLAIYQAFPSFLASVSWSWLLSTLLLLC